MNIRNVAAPSEDGLPVYINRDSPHLDIYKEKNQCRFLYIYV